MVCFLVGLLVLYGILGNLEIPGLVRVYRYCCKYNSSRERGREFIMKSSGIVWAILTIALLVIVAPAMKTFFEGLVEVINPVTLAAYPIIELIFNNITLWIILVTIGGVGWAIFKHFRKGGTKF